MLYEAVEYDPTPVWQGRNEHYRYTLHRALIEDAGEGCYAEGYVLRYTNGTESDIVEAYVEEDQGPGNGFYAEMVHESRVGCGPLPRADRRAVERFAKFFANLCEREGRPLLENEILI